MTHLFLLIMFIATTINSYHVYKNIVPNESKLVDLDNDMQMMTHLLSCKQLISLINIVCVLCLAFYFYLYYLLMGLNFWVGIYLGLISICYKIVSLVRRSNALLYFMERYDDAFVRLDRFTRLDKYRIPCIAYLDCAVVVYLMTHI